MEWKLVFLGLSLGWQTVVGAMMMRQTYDCYRSKKPYSKIYMLIAACLATGFLFSAGQIVNELGF